MSAARPHLFLAVLALGCSSTPQKSERSAGEMARATGAQPACQATPAGTPLTVRRAHEDSEGSVNVVVDTLVVDEPTIARSLKSLRDSLFDKANAKATACAQFRRCQDARSAGVRDPSCDGVAWVACDYRLSCRHVHNDGAFFSASCETFDAYDRTEQSLLFVRRGAGFERVALRELFTAAPEGLAPDAPLELSYDGVKLGGQALEAPRLKSKLSCLGAALASGAPKSSWGPRPAAADCRRPAAAAPLKVTKRDVGRKGGRAVLEGWLFTAAELDALTSELELAVASEWRDALAWPAESCNPCVVAFSCAVTRNDGVVFSALCMHQDAIVNSRAYVTGYNYLRDDSGWRRIRLRELFVQPEAVEDAKLKGLLELDSDIDWDSSRNFALHAGGVQFLIDIHHPFDVDRGLVGMRDLAGELACPFDRLFGE